MRTGSVRVSDVRTEGRRLTGGFHLSEDQEAIRLITNFRGPTQPLHELAVPGGIFRGPIFKRIYAQDPERGAPYVSAKDLVQADIRPTFFLSHLPGPLIQELTLEEGMILITRSGMNLGRAIWTRRDMAGLCASDDLIRIRADARVVPPGYLYAFLASRYGHAVIRKQIYCGNIKHIEPHHIASLQIPRLSVELESKAHELVARAASKRADASARLTAVVRQLEETAGLVRVDPITPLFVSTNSSNLQERMDAFFHRTFHREPLQEVGQHKCPLRTVGRIAQDIVEPVRFKRSPVNDHSRGIPFFGASALMRAEPRPVYYLPRFQRGIERYVVGREMLLIPRSGQISGIIGSAVLPYGSVVGGAVTEDVIRVRCKDKETAGFLFVALTSAYGLRQLKARAYGSSIPHLDVRQIAAVLVPDPGQEKRFELGHIGVSVAGFRDEALRLEYKARAIVENTLEETV